MKYKIWMQVVPQIQKDLMNQLYSSRARFEINVALGNFTIWNITEFSLSDYNFRLEINTGNNNKVIYIQRDNILQFTLHF
jgi:hypothetical protein